MLAWAYLLCEQIVCMCAYVNVSVHVCMRVCLARILQVKTAGIGYLYVLSWCSALVYCLLMLVPQVCSGSGDWILHQARKRPDVNWVAVELRHHRIAPLFARMVLERVHNLALMSGDATFMLPNRVKPNSVDEVLFVARSYIYVCL